MITRGNEGTVGKEDEGRRTEAGKQGKERFKRDWARSSGCGLWEDQKLVLPIDSARGEPGRLCRGYCLSHMRYEAGA